MYGVLLPFCPQKVLQIDCGKEFEALKSDLQASVIDNKAPFEVLHNHAIDYSLLKIILQFHPVLLAQLNSGNIIADLPCQHQPGNIAFDLSSQQQPIVIVPVNTRGIYRPKVWLAVHEESEPSTVQEALSDPKFGLLCMRSVSNKDLLQEFLEYY
ncbi:hypothetical protein LWI28_009191 [Acer negundo]|uniref:Uncharacterized protein n=1 Tax=Acer negundo TaxID=4023 RepID=A0AAD5IHT5_ACENE|nr:hypothetical protein LWI28_009191 [Acer negundo]